MRLFRRCWLISAVLSLVLAPVASADALVGEKQILLRDKAGQEVRIGTLRFVPEGEMSGYELHIDHSQFKDYFLSMKEMKCLEGPELWCHLPYPYEQPHRVSADDLSWLSHDLLFMFKQPDQFGANFWNGIYYQLQIKDDQIVGEAQAVDLNLLASPPDQPEQPPFTEAERDEIDRSKRWLPDLIIR